MRYKLTIEYCGKDLIGWQKQKDFPNSAQGLIEEALFNLTGSKVEIHGSGRTDAGVHALAQIAHFDLKQNISHQPSADANFTANDRRSTPRGPQTGTSNRCSSFDAFKMKAGLNHFLKNSNVAILDCCEMDENFHSRFNAKRRHYQYRIINRHAQLTFERDFAWKVATPLNLEKMREAAQFLIGTHDFTSFRDSECQAKTPVKTLEKIEILRTGDEIKLNFSAKSFLHHQVRNMVGTLVLVGEGKIKPDDVKKILEAKDRTKSGPNAPAWGLYFVGVDY